jgi:hypothetical protein
MNFFVRGLRGALSSLHEVRITTESDLLARQQLASADVSECREFAAAGGFEKLGVVTERPRLGFAGRVEEVWRHPNEPVFLVLSGSGYHFATRLDAGLLVTWGHRRVVTRSTARFHSHASRGTFARNLEAHLESISATGTPAHDHSTLEEHVAMLHDYRREHVGLGRLVATTLSGLGAGIATPRTVSQWHADLLGASLADVRGAVSRAARWKESLEPTLR